MIQCCLWTLFEYFIVDKLMGFPLSLALTNFQNAPLIQVASIGGIHLVSFVIFMSNVAISHIEFKKIVSSIRMIDFVRQCRTLVFVVLLMVFVFTWGLSQIDSVSKNNDDFVKISLIQPNISQYDLSLMTNNKYYFEWELQNLFNMSRYAKETFHPDLIIWPESVLKEKIFSEEFYYQFKNEAKELDANLIVHSVFLDKPKDQLFSSVIYYKGDHIEGVNHKKKIVPIFESADYSIGSHPNVFFGVANKVNLGAMICFENLFSHISRSLYKEGATVLLCIANNGYFGESNWPFLHAAYSVFRSVEYRRPYIFLNNRGYSIITNAAGEIIHSSPFNKNNISTISIAGSHELTFYGNYPYFFVLSCAVVCFIFIFCSQFNVVKGGLVRFIDKIFYKRGMYENK